MPGIIRIGTRESQLAVWQATRVSELLSHQGHHSELVYIKSEGDTDLVTPLYEMGVQGIFTKSLDIALLQGRIDLAVHSMKDVPVVLPLGLVQVAVLKRGSYKDILVTRPALSTKDSADPLRIATSSIRRKAQWLNRYPGSQIENLRGNVNTRLKKLAESDWDGAIFAAAGLERIGLRPDNSTDLDWMLPAPAQGAIMVVGRMEDRRMMDACRHFNDETTAFCVKAERDFLKTLLGGCSAPISALARLENDQLILRSNLLSVNGIRKLKVEKKLPLERSYSLGMDAALEILDQGGDKIMEAIRKNEG